MRVESRPLAPAAGPAPRRADGTAFTLGGAAPNRAAGAPAPAVPLAGLDAILTLQAQTDTPQERRRRAVERGRDLLDGLDRLKAALLGGQVAAGDLRAIAGRLGERGPLCDDPRLDGLMAEIELRAAVELAKLDRARGV